MKSPFCLTGCRDRGDEGRNGQRAHELQWAWGHRHYGRVADLCGGDEGSRISRVVWVVAPRGEFLNEASNHEAPGKIISDNVPEVPLAKGRLD